MYYDNFLELFTKCNIYSPKNATKNDNECHHLSTIFKFSQ